MAEAIGASSDPNSTTAYESPAERVRSNRRSESRRLSEIVAVRMTSEDKQRFTDLADRHRVTLPEMFRLAAETALMQEAIMEVHRG